MAGNKTMVAPLGYIEFNGVEIERADGINWTLDYETLPLYQIGQLSSFEIVVLRYLGNGQLSRMSASYIREHKHKGNFSLAVANDEQLERNILFGREGNMYVYKRRGMYDNSGSFTGVERQKELFGVLLGLIITSDALSMAMTGAAVNTTNFTFREATRGAQPLQDNE